MYYPICYFVCCHCTMNARKYVCQISTDFVVPRPRYDDLNKSDKNGVSKLLIWRILNCGTCACDSSALT